MQTVSTNICERMGRSQELSEFQRGTVIGWHLCNKSSREISSLLNIPQSTVSCIIRKWKCLGTTATQPWSGRTGKRRGRGQMMLMGGATSYWLGMGWTKAHMWVKAVITVIILCLKNRQKGAGLQGRQSHVGLLQRVYVCLRWERKKRQRPPNYTVSSQSKPGFQCPNKPL